jgi:ABC-type glycerol-3-phosphate transport system permease component
MKQRTSIGHYILILVLLVIFFVPTLWILLTSIKISGGIRLPPGTYRNRNFSGNHPSGPPAVLLSAEDYQRAYSRSIKRLIGTSARSK